MHFWRHVIFAGGFLPHGYCHVRTMDLRGADVLSDSLIAATALSIPRPIRNEPAEMSG